MIDTDKIDINDYRYRQVLSSEPYKIKTFINSYYESDQNLE